MLGEKTLPNLQKEPEAGWGEPEAEREPEAGGSRRGCPVLAGLGVGRLLSLPASPERPRFRPSFLGLP